MALLSLAKVQSNAVSEIAIAAWNTGDEYQRIGVLSALKTNGSELSPIYLRQAQAHGREKLGSATREYADELANEILTLTAADRSKLET